jgi:tRNA/tmRNA/rRNA uracil-C5-methylase (TrmA/RlmC/RlmD family)
MDGVPLAPLMLSPQPRQYRTVSKRKAFRRGRRLMLGLIDPDADSGDHAVEVLRCAIEPSSHARIYEAVDRWLGKPVAGPFLEALQYVIIKGDDRERMVILNVRSIDAGVVRAANTLSKAITVDDQTVRGFFLYEDASDGRYYMGTTSSGAPGKLQRLYGSATLSHVTAGKRFVYPVQSFSQVNQSMLDPMVERIGGLLQLPVAGTLYDLYCGYGLFGISFADRAKRVTGADLAPPAIEAAGKIATHLKISNARFMRSDLNEASLAGLMQRAGPSDVVILDPPRSGTAPGVIEVVASRRCRRVVHLFCNIEVLPEEVKRWKDAGYRFVEAVPMDMFPGTGTVEIAAVFAP